jgi:hypothetical protein
VHKHERISQYGKQIHNDKEQLQFQRLSSAVISKYDKPSASSARLLSFSVLFIGTIGRIGTPSVKRGIFGIHE